jgi:hypothetical protein
MPPKPQGLSREQVQRWAKLNKLVADAGFWTISAPNTFPILLAVSDPEIGSVMEGFGGSGESSKGGITIHVRFVEWREWLLPVTETRKLNDTNTTVATQHVGLGQVAVYEVI